MDQDKNIKKNKFLKASINGKVSPACCALALVRAAVASSALVLDVNVVSEREILSDIENFANEYGAESGAGGGGEEGSKKTAPVQYDASIDDMISELGIQV